MFQKNTLFLPTPTGGGGVEMQCPQITLWVNVAVCGELLGAGAGRRYALSARSGLKVVP